jgi:hypothetical protein
MDFNKIMEFCFLKDLKASYRPSRMFTNQIQQRTRFYTYKETCAKGNACVYRW